MICYEQRAEQVPEPFRTRLRVTSAPSELSTAGRLRKPWGPLFADGVFGYVDAVGNSEPTSAV